MEAHHARDVLAQVVASLPAGTASSAGQRAVGHDRIADGEPLDALADGRDLARRLGADGERQLALGERHSAKPPHVDEVEADRAHPDLHLARTRGGGRLDLGEAQVAVAEELEGLHQE